MSALSPLGLILLLLSCHNSVHPETALQKLYRVYGLIDPEGEKEMGDRLG